VTALQLTIIAVKTTTHVTSGWAGDVCEVNPNDCLAVLEPCKNGGNCRDKLGFFICDCPRGFEGDDCSEDTNECLDTPCENGGACIDLPGGFTCSCALGFSGPACLDQTDECLSNPCVNGGLCRDLSSNYTCLCLPGYTGYNCGVVKNKCVPDPCLNDALCIDGDNAFTCLCNLGFEGKRCQTNTDDCAQIPCGDHGACQDRVNGFRCKCKGVHAHLDTYRQRHNPTNTCKHTFASFLNPSSPHSLLQMHIVGFSGLLCDERFSECKSSPCQNQGLCVDGINDYMCKCR
jgi:Notch-like protein